MPKTKRGRRGAEIDEREIIHTAIDAGIERLVRYHPQFRNQSEYIRRHIDPISLRKRLFGVRDLLESKGIKEKELGQYLYKKLSDYVASGEVLDEAGKRVILKKGLEGKIGKSGDKIGKIEAAFGDLYEMIKHGDYAQRMPQFYKVVSEIYDLGFLDSALDVLNSYGLLNKRSYEAIKGTIRSRVEESTRQISSVYEEKLGESKAQNAKLYRKRFSRVAAVIIAVCAFVFIISSGFGITGNVIGAREGDVYGGLFGFLLLIIAWLVFFIKND